MLLLAGLPLLPVKVARQLSGLEGDASVYCRFRRLGEVGLVGRVQTSLGLCRPLGLSYLTDLGLAALALVEGVEPEPMARRNGLRASDLLGVLSGLPQLIACYEMLGALAASGPGRPRLLDWERPWRRRYQPVTAKSTTTVAMPAHCVLSWNGNSSSFLLLPDLSTFPLRAYRRTIDQLLSLRNTWRSDLPVLLVAATDCQRVAAWRTLLADAARAKAEAPLETIIVRWEDLRTGTISPDYLGTRFRASSPRTSRRVSLPPLRPRHAGSRLPTLVGGILTAPVQRLLKEPRTVPACLSPTDRELLDFLARHPFQSAERISVVYGWQERWSRQRRNRLIAYGLVRLLEEQEVGKEYAAMELAELTADGLNLVAAQQGLSLASAVRLNGLAGGGPRQPVGSRRKLLANLAHTIGADAVFTSLFETARKMREKGADDAVIEWRNGAACSRGHLRPDGYGIYRHCGQLYGFFLEYDRGTMSARDYMEKFGAYYDYLESGRFLQDYQGFPTVLVVATNDAAEERVARTVRTFAAVHGVEVPVLLTVGRRALQDESNRDGLLGQIWREPRTTECRRWLLGSADEPTAAR